MEKKPLIILAGPTASGKTALSVRLAHRINGAVISADSMQVYRQMDIGSAKITESEREGVPHYLIDVLDPGEEFSVRTFQQMGRAALAEIYANGQIPIVAGGTGFYIQALLYDIQFTDTAGEDDGFRKKMEDLAREKGALWLHERLAEADPEAARQIHPNNVKRTLRALEYYHQTGMPISAHNAAERLRPSPYRYAYFVLEPDREELYRRIDRRVDEMLAAGLLDEVSRLAAMGYTREMTSMQGLGYKELLDFLSGEIPYGEAVYRIKRDTRHFAKRQMTWFRRERDVCRIAVSGKNTDQILAEILDILREKGILENGDAAEDPDGEHTERGSEE